jgi:hypothetical protein
VVDVEQDIVAAGAQIVWVLEQGPQFQLGTAQECHRVMAELGSQAGWCVGDDEALPRPDAWDESEFSDGRGFDLIVPRSTMQIVYSTSHGTPSGNENLTGADVLVEVQRVLAESGT